MLCAAEPSLVCFSGLGTKFVQVSTYFATKCTVLYCTVLYCTVLYCTVLYCTALYCLVLLCLSLHLTHSPIIVFYLPLLHALFLPTFNSFPFLINYRLFSPFFHLHSFFPLSLPFYFPSFSILISVLTSPFLPFLSYFLSSLFLFLFLFHFLSPIKLYYTI